MTYLLLAVTCSLGIAMIFKHAGRQGMDRVTLLTANYATAALLALLLIGLGAKRTAGGLAPDPWLIALGAGTGVLFIAGFFLLSLATDVAGMSIATGVMRVSVVIPFLASWLIWEEVPTPAQGAGLVCAGIAFFMIAAKGEGGRGERQDVSGGAGTRSKSTRSRALTARRTAPEANGSGGRRRQGKKAAAVATPPASSVEAAATDDDEPAAGVVRAFGVHSKNTRSRSFIALVLLFLAGGAVDTCMKTFDETFADESSRALFLLMIFGVAFLVGGAELVRRRVKHHGDLTRWRPLAAAPLAWGALLGVVNYGSVEFLLRAIRQLRGPFVFPANNISIVVGAALLGVWFWSEHLSTLNKAGLGVAALALFLLRP